MTIDPPISEEVTNYLRFVDCCTKQEIYFRGSISLTNGGVYSYIGTLPFVGFGGNLQTNHCYTVFQEYTADPTAYPPAPTLGVLSLKEGTGCDDPECEACSPPPPCECPEGYTLVGDNCEAEIEVAAQYSGELLTLTEGAKNLGYCRFGLRLYPDITTMTWPILGDGANNSLYVVEQNNGAGAVVNPTANIQNEVWGKPGNPCFTGDQGGRLNIAGVWANNYPLNSELAFEFCVTITGLFPKQYMIGLAGDNFVKFYIDGNLAVHLNAPVDTVTIPYNYWHVFPITLSPGTHIIKLAGLNLSSVAAFAGEIYDITLAQFQATLMTPAVSAGNCGTSPADLEPYILFTTRDLVGQQVANPSVPGVWSCPGGDPVDFCAGIPVCKITDSFPLSCDCYMIIPCDGTEPFITNNADFEIHVNSFHTVDSSVYTGCAYIVKLENNQCGETIVDATVGRDDCTCDSNCYYVYNSNGFLYVDEDDTLQEVTSFEAKPFVRICSKIYPVVENNSVDFQIVNLGACEDNTCPTLCFKLTNCDNASSVIYTNSAALLPYIYGSNNIVKLLNKEGCWIASELDEGEICDCPVDVTVTASYATCLDCIGYIAYKLTSCTSNDVIYTLLNLEAYVDNIIKVDCGCYSVEQVNYLPPNPQVLQLVDIYTSCIECTRSYWELRDCTGQADPVITYTDLSLYVGQTVKIEGCTECWSVFETEEHINATQVVVTESYINCPTCNTDLPCLCSQVTNYGDIIRTYRYLNCDKEYYTITLQPGESSEKLCVIQWLPVNYCSCFLFKITIGEQSTVYTASLIPNQEINNYPVYELCQGPTCGTVSFDGTTWVVYDSNGAPIYTLVDQTIGTCPIGTWELVNEPTEEILIESLSCPSVCKCVNLSVSDEQGTIIQYQFTFSNYDENGNPVYENTIRQYNIVMDPNTGCWILTFGTDVLTLCNTPTCPIGIWIPDAPTNNNYSTTDCSVPPSPDEFLPTDYFQTFGECQHGVCPPPNFKNNRTVKPGYNTPNCNPDEYDKITCKYSTVMYKQVLERRYGITNCCPDEDEKWLLKKELIDLQALKDPHYNCPDCPCSCNSGKSHSTCNCGN